MPELPEVETVRRGLESFILGKKFAQVELLYPRMVNLDSDEFVERLRGQTIEKMERRGKYLLFHLTKDVLVSHLRMEGKFYFYPQEIPHDKHAHVYFHFTDKTTLVYQDVRKFGTMDLLAKDQLDLFFQSKHLGPEPTEQDFELNRFKEALATSRKLIKPHLLDQTLVVGLGNIYVDEVLWRAKVHPARRSSTLKSKEVKAIRQATIEVLSLAIQKGGSTIRSYQNAFGSAGEMQEFLEVYGKTGQACSRCGHPIQKIKLAGRGTHFCPRCQVEK